MKYSKGLQFVSNGDRTCCVLGIGTCTDTRIVIPSASPTGDTVTSIGDYAFDDCTGLTSVTIPDSVTSIGNDAFYYCTGLTSITIPDSVTSIGRYAFSGCDRLVEVRNLSSLTIEAGSSDNGDVGCYAKHVYRDGESYLHTTDDGFVFYDDGSEVYLIQYNGTETDLALPANYNGKNYTINRYAFYYCTSLTSITIPDSVTSIGSGAFRGCTGLTSVTIPNSVTSIGWHAFSDCTSLTSVKNNYKAFSLTKKGGLKCRNKYYRIGRKSVCRGELKPCENGIHYCTNIFDIFNYYAGEYGKDFVIGICDVSDENIGENSDSKRCARWIVPKKILTREEVISIMNGGDAE